MRGVVVATTFAFAVLTGWSAQAADARPVPALTVDAFAEYLALFNAGDPRFAEFYTPDVTLQTPDKGTIRGSKSVIDYFAARRERVSEHLAPGEIAISDDNQLLAAELTLRSLAQVDGVAIGNKVLKKGELTVTTNVTFFKLARGRIAAMREAVNAIRINRAKQ